MSRKKSRKKKSVPCGERVAYHDGQVAEVDWRGMGTHSYIQFIDPRTNELFGRVVPSSSLKAIEAHWEGARVRNTIYRSGAITVSELSLRPSLKKDLKLPRHQAPAFNFFEERARG